MPFMHNALDLDSQRVKRSAGAPDLLGRIEQLGWHLEHAQWLFVQSGAVSREYGGFVNREHEVTTVTGRVTGIYLFRRSDHANE